MNSIKKTLKFIGKILLGIIAFLVLYLLAAFLFSSITINKKFKPKEEVAIYILTNGVHTDIVVPTHDLQMDWSAEIKYTNTLSSNTNYPFLAMGWGDKGIYLDTPTWAELKVSTALKAAFGLSGTAIHTSYYSKMVENESCKKIGISKDQYALLINYITASFKKNSNGHFINIETDAQYGETDAFYEANGSYSFFHTCNTWANNGLKESGLKACFWTPFDKGIFSKYD